MWLKMIVSAALISGFLFSCATVKRTAQPSKPGKVELVAIDQDTTEYELLIIDPGFETWLSAHHKPVWYYSNDYLAAWNFQYVVAWNLKVQESNLGQNQADNPFILEIDYRPHIDYGIELNYKLYNYFKYVEATWGRILPFDRQN